MKSRLRSQNLFDDNDMLVGIELRTLNLVHFPDYALLKKDEMKKRLLHSCMFVPNSNVTFKPLGKVLLNESFCGLTYRLEVYLGIIGTESGAP